MNPFPQRYQAYSAAALLDILDHPDDYLPEALDAARAELASRNLSEADLATAKQEWMAIQAENRASHSLRVSVRIRSMLDAVWDALNPIQAAMPTAERFMRGITILFALLTLAYWCTQIDLAIFVLANFVVELEGYVVELCLTLMLLPLATILFALRQTLGWYLVAGYLTYAGVLAAGLIIVAWDSLGCPVSAAFRAGTGLGRFVIWRAALGGVPACHPGTFQGQRAGGAHNPGQNRGIGCLDGMAPARMIRDRRCWLPLALPCEKTISHCDQCFDTLKA